MQHFLLSYKREYSTLTMTPKLRGPDGSSPSIAWFVSAVNIGVAVTAFIDASTSICLKAQMVGVCRELSFSFENRTAPESKLQRIVCIYLIR